MAKGIARRVRAKGRVVYLAQVRAGTGESERYDSKTFDDFQAAVDWYDVRKGELKGDAPPLKAPKETKKTSFGDALEWAIELLKARRLANEAAGKILEGTSNDRNLLAKLRWWLWLDEKNKIRKKICDTSLVTLTRVHLRAEIQAAQEAGDGGTQTQIHRINAVAWLYKIWRDEHDLDVRQLPSPTEEARPPTPKGRTRRCKDARAAGADKLDEEAAALEEARRSKSPWLAPAIIIAIDTAIRQDELVQLEWERHVYLEVAKPYIHLTEDITKGAKGKAGGKPRSIRLTARAADAFRELKEQDQRRCTQWATEHPDRPPLTPSLKPLPVQTTRGIIHAWAKLISDARAKAVEGGMTPEEAEATIFPKLNWHDLRHEGISRWFERTNIDELKIAEIAGHNSLETTRIYTHLRGADVEIEAPPQAGVQAAPVDEPGTVKLTEAGVVVLTVKGTWVPLAQADRLTRQYAEELLREAMAPPDDAKT